MITFVFYRVVWRYYGGGYVRVAATKRAPSKLRLSHWMHLQINDARRYGWAGSPARRTPLRHRPVSFTRAMPRIHRYRNNTNK